jgi:hypothetical protein
MHSSSLWTRDNPRSSAWTDIARDALVAPRLPPDRLTDRRYRDFLENITPRLLEDVPLALGKEMWFQDGGAPAH